MRETFSLKIGLTGLLLLLVCAVTQAQSVEELIQKGDVYDKKFKPVEALEFYLPAEKADPNNVPLLLRIARQYRHMMADTGSKGEKVRLGHVSLEYAERAAALARNDSDAQLSVAISYGKMLPYLGSGEQVDASRRIKDTAEKAIRLNSKNDLAWHILGRWHRGRADVNAVKAALGSMLYGSLPPGSTEEAVKCYEKAIALNPNRLMHYIELGRAYAQLGKPEEARKYIEKGLAMPNREKDDPDTKQRGRETLAELQ